VSFHSDGSGPPGPVTLLSDKVSHRLDDLAMALVGWGLKIEFLFLPSCSPT
jgi:hypothetical protein